MASKLVFIGEDLKAPPATRDAFQMLPQVGLKSSLLIHNFQKTTCLLLTYYTYLRLRYTSSCLMFVVLFECFRNKIYISFHIII